MDIFSKNKHLFEKKNSIKHNIEENEKKSCVKNNIYKYNIVNYLTNISISNNNIINICIFNINNKSPILSYLLIKNNNYYSFPTIENTTNIIEKCNLFVFNLLKHNLTPIGFIHKENQSYIFYNFENNIIHSNHTWCIIDEICHLFEYPLTNDEN